MRYKDNLPPISVHNLDDGLYINGTEVLLTNPKEQVHESLSTISRDTRGAHGVIRSIFANSIVEETWFMGRKWGVSRWVYAHKVEIQLHKDGNFVDEFEIREGG